MSGRRLTWKECDLHQAVASSASMAGVLRALRLRPAGGKYESVRRHIERLSLSTAHWTGQAHRRGTHVPVRPRRPLTLLLRRGSVYHSNKLRRRLIAEGVLKPRCSRCGLPQWLGRPIPLELDHVDGDRTNNELGNLRLLCANCHAFTPTYRGRNQHRRPSMNTEPGAAN